MSENINTGASIEETASAEASATEARAIESADTEDVETAVSGGGKRRGSREASDLRKWIRFFSLASVLLMAAFTLATVMAFSHYRTYPGRVERDSISSPGRGSDYIVISWDEARNTDVYKVWYKENKKGKKAE